MIRRVLAEMRWLAESAGYWIRPYDMLADRRRWKWHPRQRCGFSYGLHEPTDACQGTHCYSCGLDHTGKAWRWCLECGHAWTPRDLRRAYRRAILDDARLLDRPLFRSSEWLMSLTSVLWRALTVRASSITFCQLCTHDF